VSPAAGFSRFSLARGPFARYFYDPAFIVHSSLHSQRVYMRARARAAGFPRGSASASAVPELPVGPTAVGTSPANRRLRFTTGSSYFYERHSAPEISPLARSSRARRWKRAPKDFSSSARAAAPATALVEHNRRGEHGE